MQNGAFLLPCRKVNYVYIELRFSEVEVHKHEKENNEAKIQTSLFRDSFLLH